VLNGNPPLVFEDGRQNRDFFSVYDVASAVRLALETPAAAGSVFNIASGMPMTMQEVAQHTVRTLGRSDLEPVITGKYRAGDIRHCFADITKARTVVGYAPRVDFEDGLRDLAEWLDNQRPVDHLRKEAPYPTAAGHAPN
jgi:dTDP-L-rhamnose 4-epimerase